MQISDQTPVIVTGGASGLGKATAEAFAAAGAPVTIFDINDEAGEAAAKSIGGKFCHVNILEEDSVVAGFEAARAAHGQERIVIELFRVFRKTHAVVCDKYVDHAIRLLNQTNVDACAL